jgi:uncharacterized protein YraI
MFLRSLFAAAVVVAVAAPDAAQAWSCRASATVMLRTGPGTNYGAITRIPAGALVNVYGCAGWCRVAYRGTPGFVFERVLGYGSLRQPLYLSPVQTRKGTYFSPVYVPPQTAYLASAPIRPASYERADWYAGRAFYFNGRYLNRPDLFFVYGR